jgi:hypothetical protein
LVVTRSVTTLKILIRAVLTFDPYGAWQARLPGLRLPWMPEDALLRHIDDE